MAQRTRPASKTAYFEAARRCDASDLARGLSTEGVTVAALATREQRTVLGIGQ